MLHRSIAADAERKVRAGLLMAAIARKNEFKVTDEDMEKGLAELAEETGKNVAKLRVEYREKSKRDILIGMILEDKILDFIETKSNIKDGDPPKPEPTADDPYGDIDFQSFDQYLNDGASRPRETEVFEKPSFENFLAKPQTLSDHLEWQLGLATVDENIRMACHSIIGNLNEDGYLLAVDENGREAPIALEEIAESGLVSSREGDLSHGSSHDAQAFYDRFRDRRQGRPQT